MLNGIKGAIAESMLARVAKDPNLASNILGVAAAALVGQHLSFAKLFAGDPNEIGTAAGCVVAALICFYIGKPTAKKAL